MTRAHLESAADRGGELEPVEEAAAAPHTGAVVGVAVGGVAAHVSSLVRIIMVSFTPDPDLTVSRAPGAVTGALDMGLGQWEPEHSHQHHAELNHD